MASGFARSGYAVVKAVAFTLLALALGLQSGDQAVGIASGSWDRCSPGCRWRLQDFTSSKPVMGLGLFLARHSPRWVGCALARVAASIIARQKPELYWTVRANLRQIVGPAVDDGALHESVA